MSMNPEILPYIFLTHTSLEKGMEEDARLTFLSGKSAAPGGKFNPILLIKSFICSTVDEPCQRQAWGAMMDLRVASAILSMQTPLDQ